MICLLFTSDDTEVRRRCR